MTKAHRALIDGFVAMGAQTKGFKKAIVALVQGDEEWEPELAADVCILPDAYEITAAGDVICYEAEYSNHVNGERLAHYVNIWWMLEYFGIDLRLVVAERRGSLVEVDMVKAAWDGA